MAAAIIYKVEEREELRPGAVSLVHGVGIAACVGAEPFVKPADRVVVGVHRIGGEECRDPRHRGRRPAQQGGEQAVIDMVGISGEYVTKQFSFGLVVGGLEAAQHS